MRRQAAQGLLAGRHRLQGVRLLPDRQPREPEELRARGQRRRTGRRIGNRTARRPTPRPRPATSPPAAATRRPGRRSASSSSSSRPRPVVVFVFLVRPHPPRRARRSPDLPWPGTWPASASSAAPGSMSSSTPPRRWRSRPRSACRAIRSSIGEVAGRRVAFVPRHGRGHRFPPHRIPYRANLWALRSVGVRQVLAPSAVGSLTTTLRARHAGRAGPARGPDLRPGADVLRRGHRGARPVRRPVLPGRPVPRGGGRAGPGMGAGRVRHAR